MKHIISIILLFIGLAAYSQSGVRPNQIQGSPYKKGILQATGKYYDHARRDTFYTYAHVPLDSLGIAIPDSTNQRGTLTFVSDTLFYKPCPSCAISDTVDLVKYLYSLNPAGGGLFNTIQLLDGYGNVVSSFSYSIYDGLYTDYSPTTNIIEIYNDFEAYVGRRTEDLSDLQDLVYRSNDSIYRKEGPSGTPIFITKIDTSNVNEYGNISISNDSLYYRQCPTCSYVFKGVVGSVYDGSETIVTEGGNIDVIGSGTIGDPYVVTNLSPEISEIDSIDQYTFILDKGSNPADTVRFEFDSIFAPNVDIALFDTFDINNIVFFAAILRPALNQTTGVITWELINDPDHIPVFDGAITTPTANTVRIAYKEPIKKILWFHVSPDDALAQTGVSAGASVGLSYATIHMSVPWTTRQIVTYNGSAWTNTGHVFTTVTQSGTTILSTISSGGFYNSEYTYGNVQAIYAGTNNRVLRQIFSGLGYWQTKWELIDPTTGSAATPDTNDKIVLFNPNLAYTLPSQTADGMGVARRVFDPTISPNFWISGAFLKN